ncbi:hypothetical protein GCM10022410_13520 [Amphibacillus indicireducens]|uniref:Uncharacterized protein n=1 Tax=Amphibacillus indicireducens TaxID=1076330 RepID=A0ABP7VJZ1_9BACI
MIVNVVDGTMKIVFHCLSQKPYTYTSKINDSGIIAIFLIKYTGSYLGALDQKLCTKMDRNMT